MEPEEKEDHMVPEESIITKLEEVKNDSVYLIVYISTRSEEEQRMQSQVGCSYLLLLGEVQAKIERSEEY